MAELSTLAADAASLPGTQERTAALTEKLQWDRRIYRERDQSLTYVCEVPVLLEQRLFALARHIQSHLPR